MWARFKAAQDQFFTAKNADLEKRDVTMATNLIKREELVLLIEALVPITNLDEAKKALREHMNTWNKIGMTHRDKRTSLDARVHAVELLIKETEAAHWRKSDPAAKARAAEVVKQLSDSIDNYEKIAAKSEAVGNAKKAAESRESADARKVWLAEAEKSLAEFS